MVICIPSGSTNVEIRAVRDSAEHAGGREVYMIYEPMAAALGAGPDVEAPEGNMVIDIGGGTTEIACISPVSYTHLDVYKRQQYKRLIRSANIETFSQTGNRLSKK